MSEFIIHFEGAKKRTLRRDAKVFLNEITVLEYFKGWDHYTFERQPAWWLDNFYNYLEAKQLYEEKNG